MNRDSSLPSLRWYFDNEQIECLLVAALRALDQLLVNVAVRHCRLPVRLVFCCFSNA